MRRLTELLQRIRLHFQRQHIADLEQLLSDLLEARQTLDDEIEHAACRLLKARLEHGAPDSIDQTLDDLIPRSYS